MKKLPNGMYEITIKGRKTPLIVRLDATILGEVVKEKNIQQPKTNSLPEEGHEKFFVCCSRLMIYTAIGAENIHHASNKATKLFGPKWTSLKRTNHDYGFTMRLWDFVGVVSFKELLKTLPN